MKLSEYLINAFKGMTKEEISLKSINGEFVLSKLKEVYGEEVSTALTKLPAFEWYLAWNEFQLHFNV